MKPYNRLQIDESLKEIPKTPLGVSGILLKILKDIFSYNSDTFKYSPVQTDSKLHIDLYQQWDSGNCNNYPALFIKRNDWYAFQEGKVLANYKRLLDPNNGMVYQCWAPISAQYSLYCIGKEYGETENLANEVYSFLLAYSDVILKEYNFSRFDALRISPISIVKEEKNSRISTVDIQLCFDYVWTITAEKAKIKEINVRASNNDV